MSTRESATLLLVDDQPANLRLLNDAFSDQYRVLMATGGEPAVALCREQQPDLVLLDVDMPQMDGYAVCTALKADPHTAHIPIIFVTSHSDPEEEARALEMGAVDFITRPFHASVVRSRVKTHITLMHSGAMILGALKEKETLLKEVYHRVKNNLGVVSSLLNLQLRLLNDVQARAAITESMERISAMALVHEKLYQSTNLASIALADYVRDLCSQLSTSAAAQARHIEVSAQVDAITVGIERAVPLGMLINELITNSLKHAFPTGRAGHVRVRVGQEASGECVLEVSDDGVGLPAAGLGNKSLGFKLIAALAGQIDGRLETCPSGGDGTTTRVRFAL